MGAARRGVLWGSAHHMVQGFEMTALWTCSHLLCTCASLRESQMTSVVLTVGCVYLLTQMYYSWVHLKFPEEISIA